MNEDEATVYFEKCLREANVLSSFLNTRLLSNREVYGTLCIFMTALNKAGAIPDGFEHEFPRHIQQYLDVVDTLERMRKDVD